MRRLSGRPPTARTAALPATLLLVLVTGACSGDSHARTGPTEEPSPSASPTATPAPRSVPLTVEVTHVAGELGRKRRAALSSAVGRTLAAYGDAAFVQGRYPRSSFRRAFGSFAPGAVREARADADLLTNRPLGPTTDAVRAVRRTAYLSVLAPKGKPSGVTAAVDWTFRVDRGDRPAQRVHLRGRLLLTRTPSGRWAIFGYDVNRSQTRSAS